MRKPFKLNIYRLFLFMGAIYGLFATLKSAEAEELMEISMNFKTLEYSSWEVVQEIFVYLSGYKLDIETPLGTEEWQSIVVSSPDNSHRILLAAPTLEELKKIWEKATDPAEWSPEKIDEDFLAIIETSATGVFEGKGSYRYPFLPRYRMEFSGNTKTGQLDTDINGDDITDYSFELKISGLPVHIPDGQKRRRAPFAPYGMGIVSPYDAGF